MQIHPTAIVDPSAQLHDSVEIGPHCHVGAHCVLGEGTVMMHGAVVRANTVLGKGNTLYEYAHLGGDPQFLGFDPKTKSGVVVGDGNHFREFCQIHRGLKDGLNTTVGNNCLFMATAHVAHDCAVGSNVVMANGSMIAGHVTVGDRAFISGLVAVHQFCRVGTLAMIGGRSGISKDVPPYVTMKHYGLVVGMNVVGMRRAGIGPEARMALKDAYKELFRSGAPVTKAVEAVRARWEGRSMPAELVHFIDFCGTKSKRGLSRGPRPGQSTESGEDDE